MVIVTPLPERKQTILFDAGQVAANMQLAAWEQGVVSCLGTVYELEKARAMLGFTPDRHQHVAMAFGYPRPGDAAPRPGRRGGRRALDEVVHGDRW